MTECSTNFSSPPKVCTNCIDQYIKFKETEYLTHHLVSITLLFKGLLYFRLMLRLLIIEHVLKCFTEAMSCHTQQKFLTLLLKKYGTIHDVNVSQIEISLI
jgi:hypothetical protein